jgi:hypothetical protein
MSAQQDDFTLDFDDEPSTDEGQTETPAVNDGDVEGTGEVETSPTLGDGAEELATKQAATPELTDEEKAAATEKAKADAAAKSAADEAERQAALATFQELVNGLFDHEDYDRATGTLPEVLNQKVVDAYAALPGAKGKLAGRQWLEGSMQESMIKGATDDPSYFMRARTFMELNTRVTKDKATKGETAAKPKVDPTEAHVKRIAAMLLAPNLVPVGDEVEEGWEAKAEELVNKLTKDTEAYRDWLALVPAEGETKPDAPKVDEVVIAAAKIAQGRAATTRTRSASTNTSTRTSTAGSGHTGDIGKHIREAMDTVAVGTFMKIADIVNVETSQYGGQAPKPSPGAIAARLFPGEGKVCNLDFVKPEGKEDGRDVKGAVRTA